MQLCLRGFALLLEPTYGDSIYSTSSLYILLLPAQEPLRTELGAGTFFLGTWPNLP